MSGVSINLLPSSSRVDQKAQKKFQIIQSSSIAFLLVLIFLASVFTAVQILQNQRVANLKNQAKLYEEKVLSFKDKEAQLFILKDRLSLIDKITKESKVSSSIVYRSFLSYIPSGIKISSVVVDRSGNVITSIVAPEILSLEQLLNNLTSEESFNEISKVDVDNLSRARDSSYRAIIKVQK